VKKTLSSLPGKTLAFIGINQIVNDLTAAENGVVVFATSSGRQYSLENINWNNGAFTKALVEGRNGKADYTQDGAVTINELDTWLADWVKQLTKIQQTPSTTKPSTVPDFPLVIVRWGDCRVTPAIKLPANSTYAAMRESAPGVIRGAVV
jgi:hypothetical protein